MENSVFTISRHVIFEIKVNKFITDLCLGGATVTSRNYFSFYRNFSQILEGNSIPCA